MSHYFFLSSGHFHTIGIQLVNTKVINLKKKNNKERKKEKKDLCVPGILK